MHTGPVPGEFTSEWKPASCACRKCGQRKVEFRDWESSCGGYDDLQYRCSCGHSWWVEGPDA